MSTLTIGTRIQVSAVEGATNRKGLKQNKTYTISEICTTPNFYTATDDKGRCFSIWDRSEENPGKIAISREGVMRYSWTENFKFLS